MYLISQLWWYLLLAFLLGALIGYLLWRACNRPLIESRLERSRKDLMSRVALLEEERSRFTTISVDAEGDVARLKMQIAALESGKDAARVRAEQLSADAATAAKRLDEANVKHAADLKRTTDELTADAARSHANEIKRTREAVTAEWTQKHVADLKKARDEVATEWAAKHSAELQKARIETAAATAASHTAALKAAREEAAAEATRRHGEDLARLKREHQSTMTAQAADLAAASSTVMPAKAEAASTPKKQQTPPQTQMASAGAAASLKKADDLKLIWGVGPEIEKLLNGHGIARFDQIATWQDKDIAWLDGVLPNFKGHAVSEKWVEQAAKLAGGWRPERPIGDKPKDILTGPRGGKADDLKLIWGVGPKLEQMLNVAGFYHFDQIAKWTAKEIEWVDTQLGDFADRAVRDKWVDQCIKLAAGWRPKSEVGDKPQ